MRRPAAPGRSTPAASAVAPGLGRTMAAVRRGLWELLVVAGACAQRVAAVRCNPTSATSGARRRGRGLSGRGPGPGASGEPPGRPGRRARPRAPEITVAPGVLNPCGRTYSIAFSPDGRLLATGTEGPRPNVHLWRLSDGGHVRDTDGAGMTTYHVEFSPDGTLLATAGGYTETGGALDTLPEIVKLFNVADGVAGPHNPGSLRLLCVDGGLLARRRAAGDGGRARPGRGLEGRRGHAGGQHRVSDHRRQRALLAG